MRRAYRARVCWIILYIELYEKSFARRICLRIDVTRDISFIGIREENRYAQNVEIDVKL